MRVAFADPLDPGRIDEIGFVAKKSVQPVIASPKEIEDALEKYYGTENADVSDLLKQLGADEDIAREAEAIGEGDDAAVIGLANEAPIVKFVNLVLMQAVQDRAGDIHFEPFEDEFRIRIKADGVLYEMVPPPRHLAFAITTRIKVMANLDIAERRLPQDGRIELTVGGHPVDLRVSVLPTMFDGRTNHAQAVLRAIRETYELPIIEPAIPKTIRFAEAPAIGRSILGTSKHHKGAEAYRQVAANLLNGHG